MSIFRTKLARSNTILCQTVKPVPLIFYPSIGTIIPTPIPVEPICSPAIVPLEVRQYDSTCTYSVGEIVVVISGITPTGDFLPCDGSQVSQTTYSLLYSIIGDYYGVGYEPSTFFLPNLTNTCASNAKYYIKFTYS
jgi:hypothetical protein